MKFLLSIFFLLPVFGQLLRLPLFDHMGLVPTDLFALVVLGFWIFQNIRKKGNMLSLPLFWPTLFFFSWSLFSLILNIGNLQLSLSESFQSFAYFIRYLAYFLTLFIFMGEVKKDLSYWKNLLFFSGFLLATLGFLQLKFFPNFYELGMQAQGWDPHIGRLLSTWFDPNFLGGYFAFILAILGGELWTKWHAKQKDRMFYILSGVFCMILVALILTFSRSAYLAFLVAGAVFALIAERRLLLVGAIVVLLGLSVSPRAQERVEDAWMSAQALFTQTEKTLDPTSRLRLQSWQVGWNIFTEHPITGVGFNTLKIVQKREWSFMTKSHAASGIDSSILTVLATTGFIGVLGFFWIFGKIVFTSLVQFFKTKDGIKLGFFAGFCGILIHSIFVNTLFFSLFLPTLFLASAIALTNNKRSE